MKRLFLIALLVLLGTQVQASAWPREKGTGFISVATRPKWPQDISTWTSKNPTDQYTTLYVDYGLSNRFSVGLDLGRSVSGAAKIIGYVNMPVIRPQNGLAMSVQMGFGTISKEKVIRPGVSVGMPTRNGWISLDSVAEINLDTRSSDLKLDATWGINMKDNKKLILQIQSGIQSGDPHFMRFAPSMVSPLTDKLDLEFGGAYGLVGDNSMGVKLGLWAKF